MCSKSSDRNSRRLAGVARAAVRLAWCAALATPALAGEWSAWAGWGLRLDDHRLLAPPGQAPPRFTSWTQSVVPGFSLSAQPLGARVDAAGSARVELGAPVPGGGLGPLHRGTAADARAALKREFGAGFDIAAEGSVARSRDLLDVDHATVSADGEATRWGASASGVSRWLEGSWRMHGWRSGTTAPGDTRSLAWGARGVLDRSPAAALFFGGHERRMDRDRESILRARAAVLGVRRAVAPGLGATIEFGAVSEQIGLERAAPRPTAALEIASPRLVVAAAPQLRVRIAHELGNEFEVELGRRAGRVAAWARASSLVDIEGSDAAGPAVIQRAALGAADTLAAATLFAVEASLARNRPYRGLPLERVHAVRVGAWVERRVQPWLSCRAGWDVLQRSANGSGTTPGFRRSRFEIQLRANAL